VMSLTLARRRSVVVVVSLLAVAAAFLLAGPLWSRGMYIRITVRPYRDPVPQELATLGAISGGQKVATGRKEDSWVQVTCGDVSGWLPSWYLSKDPKDALPPTQPYLMVVSQDSTTVRLYPEDGGQRIANLEVGKVVRVSAELRQWRYIDIAVYSIPDVMRGWVPMDSLVAMDKSQPAEGRIPAGTPFYSADADPDSPGFVDLPAERTSNAMRVRILRRADDMAYVFAPGGWAAWVPLKSIVYDPFGN